MANIETAIENQEEIIQFIRSVCFFRGSIDDQQLEKKANTVFELLKKQQKQIEEYEIQIGGLKERLEMSGLSGVPILQCYGSENHICPNCLLVLDEARDAYCPSCGMEMRWSEVDDDD